VTTAGPADGRDSGNDHNTTFTNELFHVDGRIVTCAGAGTTIDMMAHGMAPFISLDLTLDIADRINLAWLRRGSDLQTRELVDPSKIDTRELQCALWIIHDNYRDAATSSDLASCCNVGQRQLQRLFRENLGVTPTQYFTQFRLKKARHLPERTNLTVTDAAFAVGFRSVSNFSLRYARIFGAPPRTDRGAVIGAS
jgi:transcriptional regulator GlxA family with amidase domain